MAFCRLANMRSNLQSPLEKIASAGRSQRSLPIHVGPDPINSTVCADNVHADASGLDADLMDEDHPTRRIVQPLTPAATRPGTPTSDSAASRQLTVEERASHLLHELTALGSEKEALVTRLKAARKESQRADHALRNEIEAIKRASARAA